MLGHTHALSGLATGAAAGLYLTHASLTGTAGLAGLTACWATFPDFDQVGSCASRSLGFASALVARVVRKVSGGHRHGTHTLLGGGVATALVWAACHFRHAPAGRWCLAALLALALAAGMGALRVGRLRLGRRHLGPHGTEVLAISLAALMAWKGWALALVPLSCALGWAAHIAGDACTDEGVPALSPLAGGHQHLLPEPFAFTTATRPERLLAVPALLLALGWLSWHAVALAAH